MFTNKFWKLFVLFHCAFHLQAITPEQLARTTPLLCEKYRVEEAANILNLTLDFNGAQILNKSAAARIKDRTIKKITLYYSAFKLSEKFSQPFLNHDRFTNLFKLIPSLSRDQLIEWRIIAQTHCANADEARELYHGFVVEFIPAPTAGSILLEKGAIEALYAHDSLGRDTVCVVEKTRIRTKKRWAGYYLPKSAKKRHAGILYKHRTILNRKRKYVVTYDSIKTRTLTKHFIPATHAMEFIYRNAPDTTIFSVFRRKQNWNNMVFIVDVTGSMSPYTAQLLIWYKLNNNKRTVKNFTFFNDGNNKSDRQKQIGKTGGLYYTEATRPGQITESATQSMMRGFGGDAPENNCEAILLAQRMNSGATEFFMIADNWANMRDTSLAREIKKPVHIVLCGVYNNFVNTQYLDLARRTKGSVHTLEHDIENLMNINEGETITIGARDYRIVNGKFRVVNKS